MYCPLVSYQKFLDAGTNEGLRFKDENLSRYVSFLHCWLCLVSMPAPDILELGTTRSFVGGAHPGCNSSDIKYWDKDAIENWDWGAGCFTLLFGLMLKDFAKLTTVDLIKSHITRCKHMTDSLGLTNVNHVVSDSLDFLGKTDKKFDLIYLDTGDMWPIESTQELQLQEAKLIVERDLLKPGGLLLIDDVLNGTPREQGAVDNKYGKSELSLPYLESQGFKIEFKGYQYILTK